MRLVLALPFLMLAACGVDNDTANDQVTLEYNEAALSDTAADVGNAVEDVAAGVGNVAQSTGQAIENEVGDIDVDVDVNRNKGGDAADGNRQ